MSSISRPTLPVAPTTATLKPIGITPEFSPNRRTSTPDAGLLCENGREHNADLIAAGLHPRLSFSTRNVPSEHDPYGRAIMQSNSSSIGHRLSRRTVLGGAAALAATPALANECRIGPPPHEKGPVVFNGMDQVELDAAYDQIFYSPLQGQVLKRYAVGSDDVRRRLGNPQRVAYGPTEPEKLDIYRAKAPNAPIFVFIHGGAWLGGSAKSYGFPAEMFVKAGAHYVPIDFVSVRDAGGDLRPMAEQVRRAIAWVYKNAASFGGDSNKLYIGGHSSGGHLCGVALVTDWQKDFGIPADAVKGAVSMSGMYDLKAVRLSKRSSYVKFTDEMEHAMSSQRHLGMLQAPVVVTYGTNETPEFQRQSRDFAAAAKAAGKPVQLVAAESYNHFEIAESLGNPYGPNGRAALELMKLA
jgi:arylformamidase